MKKLIVLIFITGYFYKAYTQNYNVPATGTNSIETCSGYIFDPGGEFGYYGDNQDGGILIYPDDENKVVYITLEQLDLESCCDYLSIFPDENLPQDFGQTNIQLGQTIFSEAENGAMSVGFESDGSITASGFKIRIGCLSMNDTADITISSISFPGDYVVGSEQTLNINLFNDGMNTISSGVELRIAINDSNNYSTSEFIKSINTNPLTRGNNLVTTTIQIPSQLAEGYYYIFVETDPENNLNERIDSNNIGSDSVFIQEKHYDLTIRNFNYPYDYLLDGVSGFSFSLNSSGNSSCDSIEIKSFLSRDRNLDSTDSQLITRLSHENNTYYTALSFPQSLYLPDSIYYLISYIVSKCDTPEEDTANNFIIKQVITTSDKIDLSIGPINFPEKLITGNNYSLNYNAFKTGYVPVNIFNVKVYFSSDPILDTCDSLIHSTNHNIYNASGVTSYFNFNIPSDSIGNYYFILVIDSDSLIEESNEGNNIVSVPIEIEGTYYDYKLASVNYNLNASNNILTVFSQLNNLGNKNFGNIYVGYYISADSIIDGSDTNIYTGYYYTPEPGNNNTIEANFSCQNLDLNDNYLIVLIDSEFQIDEADENNNKTVLLLDVDTYDGVCFDMTYRSKKVIFADFGLIRDNGGVLNYSNNSNDTLIIIPQTTGKKLNLHVSSMSMETCCDALEIYSGIFSDTTSSEFIASVNSYSGINYFSTDSLGALSLVFRSDGSVTSAGFELIFDTTNISLESTSDIYAKEIEIDCDSLMQGEVFKFQYNFEVRDVYNYQYVNYRLYLSGDSIISNDDRILLNNSYGFNTTWTEIDQYMNLTIPENYDTGYYYLIFITDFNNTIVEVNETNNSLIRQVKIINPVLDFVPVNLSLENSICYIGENLSSVLNVKKTGTPTIGNVQCLLYLSTDTVLNETDMHLNQTFVNFGAGDYTSGSFMYSSINENISNGFYYLIAYINPDSVIIETDYSNNLIITPIVIIENRADIAFYSNEIPDSLERYNYYNLNYSLINKGYNETNCYYYTSFYLSSDTLFDGSDIFLASNLEYFSLDIFEISANQTDFYLSDVEPGRKFILGITGQYYDYPYYDIDSTNNMLVKECVIIRQPIDLSISAINIPTNLKTDNNNFELEYQVCNSYTTAYFPIQLEVYFSADNLIDNDDLLIVNIQDYYSTNCRNLYNNWVYLSNISDTGVYYFIARIYNTDDTITANNICINSVWVDYSYYDVYLSDFTIDGGLIDVMTGNKVISGNLVYGNNGTVNSRSTYLNYCLSKDTIIDPNDEFVFSSFLFNIEPDISFNSAYSFITPWFVSPRYIYLIATLDYPSVFMDEDRNNNTIILKVAEGPSPVNVQNEEEEILVFPNIVTDYVTVQNNSLNNMHLTITDNLGRIVFSEDSKSGELTIDMSYYDSGIYFLQILNEANKTLIENCKLIKQ